MSSKDMVNHPDHYGGKDNPYEAIKVIEAWNLSWHLGDAVKYIARAGKKDPSKEIEDLEKAAFYLNRRIEFLKSKKLNFTAIEQGVAIRGVSDREPPAFPRGKPAPWPDEEK